MSHYSRRKFVQVTAGATGGLLAAVKSQGVAPEAPFQLAAFSADVTPPLGHPLMGGGIVPAISINDRLFAHGLVLMGAGKPIVLTAVDWCEIRNDAHDRWRAVLASAAGTEPARVLVASVHAHDAPIADLEAERILRETKAAGSIYDPEFHELAVQHVAKALRESLRFPQQITHLGQAQVEKVASNRRYLLPDGKPAFGRMSATRDVIAREAPEGTIDPWLKTLSFWNGDQPVAPSKRIMFWRVAWLRP